MMLFFQGQGSCKGPWEGQLKAWFPDLYPGK